MALSDQLARFGLANLMRLGAARRGPRDGPVALHLARSCHSIVESILRATSVNCYWSAATVLAQLGVLGNLEGAVKKAD